MSTIPPPLPPVAQPAVYYYPTWQHPPSATMMPVTYIAHKKHPWISALLSLTIGWILPGVSYLYLTQWGKFWYFLLLFILVHVLLFWAPIISHPLAFCLVVYYGLDAFFLARRTKRGIPVAKGECTWFARWPLLAEFVGEPTVKSAPLSASVPAAGVLAMPPSAV